MVRIAHLSRWVLALLVALVAVGMDFGSAAAAPASPKPPVHQKLTQMYRFEQQRSKIQGERLKRTVAFASKLDQLIARQKDKKQDTAALERAVGSFRAALDRAWAEWQAASTGLTAHAGFDNDGKVTNADQAGATLKDAHGHMEQAHTIARNALRELHGAIAAYHKAHRGAPEVPMPLEP